MDATTALLALQLGSGLVESFGQKKQGDLAADASRYNAQIYEQQAGLIRQAAAQDKITGRRQKASFLSTQKTNYAFRGVKLTGSPLLVIADSAANLELDIQNTEFNALTRASYADSAASLSRIYARNQKLAGTTSAGATLLNTAIKGINYIPKGSGPSGPKGNGTVTGVRDDGTKINVSYP